VLLGDVAYAGRMISRSACRVGVLAATMLLGLRLAAPLLLLLLLMLGFLTRLAVSGCVGVATTFAARVQLGGIRWADATERGLITRTRVKPGASVRNLVLNSAVFVALRWFALGSVTFSSVVFAAFRGLGRWRRSLPRLGGMGRI